MNRSSMLALLVIILSLIIFNFGFVCLLTWAVCFITGLAGFALKFSWKLVFAIWIITTLITSAKTVNIRKG